ncbi:MAG: hypothetical protein ACRD8O_14080 [Bryobacteraceae bacterium]
MGPTTGYLDHYGERDARREKHWKRFWLGLIVLIVVSISAFLLLRNHKQKAQVREFIEHLQKKDYTAAYGLWGCTDAAPCRDYPFNKFMGDWGPQSRYGQIAGYNITRTRGCGSGVIVTVDFGGGREEKFWVENRDLTVTSSPWSVCPAR